jgi:hypothetical protein
MAELSPKEGWKTCKNWIKSWFCNGFFNSIWTRNKRLWSLFWRYLSHLLVDFDTRYRFRKVISCRLHDWNLDLKFANVCVKVGPRSRNLLKKVGSVTRFFWITLKFKVFCWDKYYFSESLGSKLTENYNEFKNSTLFFQGIVKQSEKVRQPTCLKTNFILIPNFPRISAKYAPKYQKRTIFYEFKQFWWIWSFMPMSNCISIYTKRLDSRIFIHLHTFLDFWFKILIILLSHNTFLILYKIFII